MLKRFDEILKEMLDLVKIKNADYAGNNNRSKNFELCEKLGVVSTERGFLVRMSDKLQRASNLIDKEGEVDDEKIGDTLNDLANYSILLRIYLEEKSNNNV